MGSLLIWDPNNKGRYAENGSALKGPAKPLTPKPVLAHIMYMYTIYIYECIYIYKP